jgi:hypothetical protein
MTKMLEPTWRTSPRGLPAQPPCRDSKGMAGEALRRQWRPRRFQLAKTPKTWGPSHAGYSGRVDLQAGLIAR